MSVCKVWRCGVVLWLCGCHGADIDSDDPVETDVPVVVPSIVIETTGAVVTMPADALRDPTVDFSITMTTDVPNPPGDTVPLTAAYAVSPLDTRFDGPVMVKLRALRGPVRAQVLRLSDDGEDWVVYDHVDVEVGSGGNTSLRFEVLRFGTFIAIESAPTEDLDGDGIGDDEDCDPTSADVLAPPLATVWIAPGASIQDEINRATSGDVLGVMAGTYPGVLNLLGKSLTLVSRCREDAVLDGQQLGVPLVTYDGGAAGSLEGFVLRNALATDGAGVFVAGAAPHIANNRFVGNQATRDGGAVYLDATSGLVVMEGNTFDGNAAARHGGALAAGGQHQLEVTGNTFADNEAGAFGGGLFFSGTGTRTVTGNTVAGGVAEDGGGMAVTGTLILRDNVIRENQAIRSGGGIYGFEGALTMEGNELTLNEAITFGGGGMSLDEVEFDIFGNRFVDNEAATDGGGVCVLGGRGGFRENSIESNHAAQDGGGLHLSLSLDESDGVTVEGNALFDNTAARGGGIADGTVQGATFAAYVGNDVHDNEASEGGGVYFMGHGATWSTGELRENRALRGAGLAAVDWTGELVDCDVTRNEATELGGGLWLDGMSAPAVWSSRFEGNQADVVGPSGGAVWVGPEASVLDETGATWPRVDHPLCGDELGNVYGESLENTPDDVTFVDAEACP
jgi:hypothetical protein